MDGALVEDRLGCNARKKVSIVVTSSAAVPEGSHLHG